MDPGGTAGARSACMPNLPSSVACCAPLLLLLASGCIEPYVDGPSSDIPPATTFAGFDSIGDGDATPASKGLATLAGFDLAGSPAVIREGAVGLELDEAAAP